MNAALRKRLLTPRTIHLKNKGKRVATIRFYTRGVFPSLKTPTERHIWWNICEVIAESIRGTDWQKMTAAQKESDALDISLQMFPDSWRELSSKHYRAPRESDLRLAVNHSIQLLQNILPLAEPITINVLPCRTVTNYAVSGDSIRSKRMLSIYCDGTKRWKKPLEETMAHEYMHVVYQYPEGNSRTMGDKIVREGLAMHFSEYVTQRKETGTDTIGYHQASALLKKHRYWLNRAMPPTTHAKLQESQQGIFHCVGYVIVGLFLDSLKTLSWEDIVTIPPKEIVRIGMLALDEKLREKRKQR